MYKYVKETIKKCLSDKIFLEYFFFKTFKRRLNLDSPQTFNEKLQWLKLYNRNAAYTQMVDKYESKKYVANIIGEEYIIPTYGIWDKFDDINFEDLPKQFVLKTTHDSGGVVICKDKLNFNIGEAKQVIETSLKRNYYNLFREWPYKNVKPRIIAEEYLEDNKTKELRDYKFFCFGGQVKCYKVDFDRFVEHHANYYDRDNNYLDFGEAEYPPIAGKKLKIPESIEKMKELAEKLSDVSPFLRADFYDVDGKIYFGELTFYPASGFGKFTSDEWDLRLGEWLDIKSGGVLRTKEFIVVLRYDKGIQDYKIHCFNGVPKFILVCGNRFGVTGLEEDFFDTEWNHMPLKRPNHSNSLLSIEKPSKLNEMLKLARKLSEGMPFLRTDFYEIAGEIYFGELTFYPASGFEKFEPEKYDEIFGEWIDLSVCVNQHYN